MDAIVSENQLRLSMTQDGSRNAYNVSLTLPTITWRPPTSDNQMRGASMFVAIVTLSVFAASICVLIYYSIKRLQHSHGTIGSESESTILGRMSDGNQRRLSQDKPPSYEDILEACKVNDESLPTYEDAQRQLQELSAATLHAAASASTENTQTSSNQSAESSTSSQQCPTETAIRIETDGEDGDTLSVASCADTNYTSLEDRTESSATIADYFHIEMQEM